MENDGKLYIHDQQAAGIYGCLFAWPAAEWGDTSSFSLYNGFFYMRVSGYATMRMTRITGYAL